MFHLFLLFSVGYCLARAPLDSIGLVETLVALDDDNQKEMNMSMILEGTTSPM